MKQLSVVLLTIGLLFTACKKESSLQPTTGTGKKISRVDYIRSGATELSAVFTYDGKGQISKITNTGFDEEFIYHTPQSFSIRRTYSGSAEIWLEEYTLNNRGAATEIIYHYPNGNIFYTTQLIYDAEGLIQQVKIIYPQQNKTYRFDHTIENGLITVKKMYENEVYQGREEYTYDQSRPFRGINQLWWTIAVPGLYGKALPHPLLQVKSYDNMGTLQWTRNYTTQLDSDGNCLEFSGTSLPDNSTGTYRFTY